MDCDCSTKGTAKHEDTILVNSDFLLTPFDYSLCILQNAILFWLTFTAAVTSVTYSYDIDIKFMVYELKPIKSKTDVSCIFMHENYSIFVSHIFFLVHKPTLQLCSILTLDPDFLKLHATLFRWLIPRRVLFNELDRLCWDVEDFFLLSPDHQKQANEHKTSIYTIF